LGKSTKSTKNSNKSFLKYIRSRKLIKVLLRSTKAQGIKETHQPNECFASAVTHSLGSCPHCHLFYRGLRR